MGERKGFSGLSDLADNLGNRYESDELGIGNEEGIYDDYEEDAVSDYEEEQVLISQLENVPPVISHPVQAQAPKPYSSNQGNLTPPLSGSEHDPENKDVGLNWTPLLRLVIGIAVLYLLFNIACSGPSLSKFSYGGNSASTYDPLPSHSSSESSYSSTNESSSSLTKSNSSTSTGIFTSKNDLVAEARRIPSNGEELGSFRGQGKVVVWDGTRNQEFSPSEVNESILWNRGDNRGYVVYIDRFTETRVSSYASKGIDRTIPGIRKDAVVYVYDLKNGRCIGSTRITGENPPDLYRSKGTPQAIYGNIHRPVGNWLNRHFY